MDGFISIPGGQITVTSLTKVQPGDLIRAEYFNGFIDVLNDLMKRVAALEAGSIPANTVIITSITATSFPIRVKMRITVKGANFAQPPDLNTVTVGGVPVNKSTFGFDSSDTVLSFDVPNVPGLLLDGQVVAVAVSNANGSASKELLLLPALIVPTGRVEVVYTAAPIGNMISGQSFVFLYEINAIVDLAATYSVIPSITGTSGWTATLLEDVGDQARASNNVQIGAFSKKTLRVKVAIPTGIPSGTGTLHVDVTSAASGTNILPGSSSPIALTIGSPAPVPDNRVTISLSTSLPIQNGKVVIPRNTATGVQLNLTFRETADYTISAELRAPAGWAPLEVSTTVFKPKIVNNAPVNAPVTIAVLPGAGAGDTDLVLAVKGTNGFKGEYSLALTVGG